MPVTLITGAGSGIGRAIAVLLAQCRHYLVLLGRREGPLQETVKLLHPAHVGCSVIMADVGIPEQALAQCRHYLVLLGRREGPLQETVKLLHPAHLACSVIMADVGIPEQAIGAVDRSEEHTSELQSHSFISYAVFCLKKK